MIQKNFNTREVRKAENQLRNKFNHAIKLVTELNLDISPKIVKQLEDAHAVELTKLIRQAILNPAQPVTEPATNGADVAVSASVSDDLPVSE